jgi:hypothetical protein
VRRTFRYRRTTKRIKTKIKSINLKGSLETSRKEPRMMINKKRKSRVSKRSLAKSQERGTSRSRRNQRSERDKVERYNDSLFYARVYFI